MVPIYRIMDEEKLAEKAAKFFPKAKDWPPPDQQKTISPIDMVTSKKSKKHLSKN